MSSAVAYEAPLTRSGARLGESLLREVITEGPAYARTRAASRWHRVRSGYQMIRLWNPDRIVEVWHFWCGQTTSSDRPVTTADTIPAGDQSCGTCEGRAIGANPDHPWRFDPWRLTPPAICPGSQTLLVREDQDRHNRATCLVCGDVVKMGARGGPYSTRWDARRHTPGPGLIPGCPFHAWRELTLAHDHDDNPVAACRCQCVERPGQPVKETK